VHTQISLDATATVEEYVRRSQSTREFLLSMASCSLNIGFIDSSIDYRKLGDRYGIQIFQGVEVDGDFRAHLAVLGSPNECLRYIDLPIDGSMTERSCAS